MKYKTSFITFNITIPLVYIVITVIPSIILGIQSTILQRSWLSIAFGITSIIVLNIYYLRNWNFFTFLESKDWKKLHELLHAQLMKKRGLKYSKLLMLIQALTIQGEHKKIIEIAEHLREVKPRLFRKTIGPLCAAFVILKDYEALSQFIEPEIKDKAPAPNPWADWFWSFALLRTRDVKKASKHLFFTATLSKDIVVRLLCLYILVDFLELEVPNNSCRQFLTRFRNKYTPASWAKYLSKRTDQLHFIVFEEFIQNAAHWCMKEFNSSPPIVSASPEETYSTDINYMEKIEELDED